MAAAGESSKWRRARRVANAMSLLRSADDDALPEPPAPNPLAALLDKASPRDYPGRFTPRFAPDNEDERELLRLRAAAGSRRRRARAPARPR